MAPGRIGKTVKGLKVLNFGRNILENQNKHLSFDKGDFSLEKEVRGIIKSILLASKDNDELLEKINKYLPDKVGNLGSKPEEILKASPIFGDHYKLSILQALQMDDEEALEKFYSKLVSKDNEIAKRLKERLTELKYQKELKDIEEFQVYGNVVAQIVSFDNPKLAKDLGTIINGVSNIGKISAAVSAEKIPTGLAAANYISIGLAMYIAFQASSEDPIAKALAGIQKLIIRATEAIMDKLELLDKRLISLQRQIGNIYYEVIAQSASINALQIKINNLEEITINRSNHLLSAIRDGFFRDLDNKASKSMAHKDIYQPGNYQMSKKDFFDYVSTFYTYATVHSTDELSISILEEDFQEEKILNTLSNSDYGLYPRVLSFALSRHSEGLFSQVPIDIRMWVLSTNVLLDLIGDWPEYQKEMSSNYLRETLNTIKPLENLIKSCSKDKNKQSYIDILEDSAFSHNRYYDRIKKLASDLFIHELRKNTRFSLSLNKEIDWGQFNETNFYKAFKKVKVNYSPLTIQAKFNTSLFSNKNYSFDAPSYVLDKLPIEVWFAHWSGGVFNGYFEFNKRRLSLSETPAHLLNRITAAYEVSLKFILKISLKLSGDEEKSYTIIDKKVNPRKMLGVNPVTKEHYINIFFRRLFVEHPLIIDNLTETNKSLAALKEDLNFFKKSIIIKFRNNLIKTLSQQSEYINLLAAAEGLKELVWRGLIIGESEEFLRKMEPYFVNHNFRLNSKLMFTSYTLSELRSQYVDHINEIISIIQEKSITTTKNIPFPYIHGSIKRLEQCIDKIESKSLWLTEYSVDRTFANNINK